MKEFRNQINYANHLIKNGNFNEAINVLEETIHYVPETLLLIDLHNTLGRLYLKNENYDKAEENFQKSLDLHEEINLESDLIELNMAVIYNNLGLIYQQKNPKEAIKYHKKALKILQNINQVPHERILNTFLSIADTALKINNRLEAKKHFKEIVKYLKSLPTKEKKSTTLEAYAHYNLGNIFVDENNMHDANKHYVKALEIYRNEVYKNKNEEFRPWLASTYNNLAVTAKLMYRYDDAIKNYEKALEQYIILSETDPGTFKPFMAETLNNLGIVWSEQEDINDDYDSYGLSSFSGFGFLSAKNIFEQQEKQLSKEKRIEKALDYFDRSLKIYHKLEEEFPGQYTHYIATLIFNMANAFDTINDFQKAEELYIKAYEIRQKLAEKNQDVFGLDEIITIMNLVTLYQTLLEKELNLDYKVKSLILLEKAEKKIKPFVEKKPEKNLIKTIVSEIQYFKEYFESIDGSFPVIENTLRQIDLLKEKRDETLNLDEKLQINEEIIKKLSDLMEQFPGNEKIKKEWIKFQADQSWISLRKGDKKKMEQANQILNKNIPDSAVAAINLAHFSAYEKTPEEVIKTYNELLEQSDDKIIFTKQLIDDLLILKNDGKIPGETIDQLIKWASNQLS